MKVTVIGLEIAEGVSKKTGKPYAIGKLYAALPIAGGGKGLMGSTYSCEPSVLRKIEHLPFDRPFLAEVEFQDVMRYGERKQEVVSIVPTAVQK